MNTPNFASRSALVRAVILSLAASFSVALSAHAEGSKPAVVEIAKAPVASTVSAEVPKHQCAPPADIPGRLASDAQMKRFRAEHNGYRDCLAAYANARRAEAQARVAAANAAVEEFNLYAAKARAQ